MTDTLLEATDPDVITPGKVASQEGARALANGTIARLGSTTGGGESTWLFGGLLADEWATRSTFVQNDETDQRAIQENNSTVTNELYNLFLGNQRNILVQNAIPFASAGDPRLPVTKRTVPARTGRRS